MIFAGVATCAATVGRLALTWSSYSLVRNCRMREADHQNIDVARARLGGRKGTTAGLTLVYAFSPFPFNCIFITYGSTRTRLWLTGLPSFAGRWVSYLTWTHIAQIGAHYLDEEIETDGAYMGVYSIVPQVVSLALVYRFAGLDWQYLLQTKHLRW